MTNRSRSTLWRRRKFQSLEWMKPIVDQFCSDAALHIAMLNSLIAILSNSGQSLQSINQYCETFLWPFASIVSRRELFSLALITVMTSLVYCCQIICARALSYSSRISSAAEKVNRMSSSNWRFCRRISSLKKRGLIIYDKSCASPYTNWMHDELILTNYASSLLLMIPAPSNLLNNSNRLWKSSKIMETRTLSDW